MRLLKFAAAATLLVPYAAFAAQGLTFQDVMKGEKIPLKMKIADIPDDYKPVRVKSGSSGMSMFDMMGGSMMAMFSMMGGSGVSDQAGAMQFMGVLDLSWTNGSTVTVNGQEYLVTYKAELTPADYAAKAPPSVKELKLFLLKGDMITSLSPEADITKQMFMDIMAKGGGGMGAAVTPADSPPSGTPEQQETLSNAKQLGLGMIMYASDWDDLMPYVQDTNAAYVVTHPYLKNRDIVKTKNPAGGFLRFNMSLAGVDHKAIPEPANTPLYYDSEAWPDGSRIVVFADGSARALTPAQWQAIQPNLRLNLPRAAKRPLPANLGKQWPIGG